jgi:hypothetical protein
MSTRPRSHRAVRPPSTRAINPSRVSRAAVAVASAIALLAGALAFAAPGFSADSSTSTASTATRTGEQSLWPLTAKPGTLVDPDRTAVELGVRFSASVDGSVTGLRFYKSRANTGTHTGSLWSADGKKLAGLTFTNETSSGWQTARFAKPVAMKAGTTYVVSYHTTVGAYSVDERYFDKPHTSGVLTAPGTTNGVYKYGASGFPAKTFRGSNYWVDPLFVPSSSTTSATTSAAPTTTSAAPTTTTSAAPTTTTSPAPTTTSAAPTTTSAAPTTTTSSTPTPTPVTGWPTTSTTGVQPGVTLQDVGGSVTLSTPGMVFENKIVHGTISVKADNVTIRNVKVVGPVTGFAAIEVRWWEGISGAVIEHVELAGPGDTDVAAIGNGGYTARNVNIHGYGDGFRAEKDVVIQDSIIWDLTGPSWAHFDAIQTTGAENIKIVHNRIENQNDQTACIQLGNEFGPIKNVVIDRNLMAGGGYSFYGGWGGDMAKNPVSNISVTNNVWSKKFFPNGGSYGPVAYFNPDGPGMVWSNNTWTDGTPVKP